MLKRCANCILPESYPGIAFNGQNVCNYCLTHKRTNYRGQAKLFDFVAPYRNSNRKYDCIVAISGGRDSAFAAYYAVRVLNLKALAYTYDNGFMPEQTKENVKNIVDILGIDHVVEKDEYMRRNQKHIISSWIRRPSPATISLLCTGCQTDYKRGLVKTVESNKIPLVILGSGEPARSFAQRLLSVSGEIGKKFPLVLGFSEEILRNPYYVLSPSCLVAFTREFFYRFLHKYNKYFDRVRIFKYIEWNEETILSVIEEELAWKKPPDSTSSWRSDCKIHLLKQYLYMRMLGFTKNDEILSGMIKENMITREEALTRLESENAISQKFLAEFLDELGVSFSDLDISLKEYEKATGSMTI
jgi:tRNA(Ile)-lysidine synthase TilS/MesJ